MTYSGMSRSSEFRVYTFEKVLCGCVWGLLSVYRGLLCVYRGLLSVYRGVF